MGYKADASRRILASGLKIEELENDRAILLLHSWRKKMS
jgi:hypothetical protein